MRRAAFAVAALLLTAAAAADVPGFRLDAAWPRLPEGRRLGDVSSVAVDDRGHVWLLHRPRTLPADQIANAAPPVLEFDAGGRFLNGWGGAGQGYEWPEREHGIHIDHRGHVWIGGNNDPTRKLPGLKPVYDDQLLEFTKAGAFVKQIGRSNQSRGDRDTANLHMPADTFVHAKTNELFVADGYGNHRVIVFDAATGAFKRMWGAFGAVPAEPLAKAPASAGADPGPLQFDTVHTVQIANDDLVYVADRGNRRVQVFTLDGRFLNQVFIKRPTEGLTARSLAFSRDAQQQFLYVGGTPEIVVLDRKSLAIVDSIQPANPHHLTTDAAGNIFSAELAEGRGIRKFVFGGLTRPKP